MKLRDQILSARTLKEREVDFLGQRVIVREMTGRERYEMAEAMRTGKGIKANGQAMVNALILCLLDPETHKPVFEPADRDALLDMSGVAIDDVITVMTQLSGLSPDAIAVAEKNSPKTESESTSS
jgi:hypothetical protein